MTFAMQTIATMNADGSATSCTMPFDLFSFGKCFYSPVPDKFEVLKKAGFVFCPVSFIKLFEPATWIFNTIIAKFRFCFRQKFAIHN